MKSPRVPVGSVIVVVFAVAVDCVAIRSVQQRPYIVSGVGEALLLGTLPMANFLAVLLMGMVWRGDRRRSFRFGFILGGLLAALGAALGIRPLLSRLEASLNSTALGHWLVSSPIGATVVAYGVLPVVLLLIQLPVALGCGWLARKLTTQKDAIPASEPPRRLQLAGVLMMMALIAAPAVATEGFLRLKVDSLTARQPAGAKAVVDVKVMSGWRVTLRDGSTCMLPNGSELRIDDDGMPSSFAGIRTPTGEQFGDHRSVSVTLLDGERSGESTSVPRQCLRAVR